MKYKRNLFMPVHPQNENMHHISSLTTYLVGRGNVYIVVVFVQINNCIIYYTSGGGSSSTTIDLAVQIPDELHNKTTI